MKKPKKAKTEIEYAIQVKMNGEYIDYSIYNRRTCGWKIPIEDWPQEILNDYEYKRCCDRRKRTRLVKRTKTEEVIRTGEGK